MPGYGTVARLAARRTEQARTSLGREASNLDRVDGTMRTRPACDALDDDGVKRVVGVDRARWECHSPVVLVLDDGFLHALGSTHDDVGPGHSGVPGKPKSGPVRSSQNPRHPLDIRSDRYEEPLVFVIRVVRDEAFTENSVSIS